ncbi:MAG: type IX secretion system membrane protein PorP/SprF [Bacteroidota bacterium]
MKRFVIYSITFRFLIFIPIITGISLCSTFYLSHAQQLPQYSQYLINDYIMNPAIGGSKDHFEAKSNHRYQWMGIVDAPRTYILSVNGPLRAKKVGVGGYLFTDITGPTSRVGIYLSYAYHINLNESVKLSLGLFGGILQYNVDGTKITLKDIADPVIGNEVKSVLIPDAGFGLYLYSKKYYFGVSIPQLLNNKLKLFEDQDAILSSLKSHLFMTGGYKILFSNDFVLEPSFLLKAVRPVPVQLDLSAKIIYRNTVWLGGSFRTYDAMSVLVGYSFKDQIFFGYSFDFSTSDIKNYSAGTHEIMLGIRFAWKEQEEKSSDSLVE